MVEDRVFSLLGFTFTKHSVMTMRRLEKLWKSENLDLVIIAYLDEHGKIMPGLGAYRVMPEEALSDKIEDVSFCWCAGDVELSKWKNLCIHFPADAAARLYEIAANDQYQ